jgi:hypothetical protein
LAKNAHEQQSSRGGEREANEEESENELEGVRDRAIKEN